MVTHVGETYDRIDELVRSGSTPSGQGIYLSVKLDPKEYEFSVSSDCCNARVINYPYLSKPLGARTSDRWICAACREMIVQPDEPGLCSSSMQLRKMSNPQVYLKWVCHWTGYPQNWVDFKISWA